MKNYSDYEIANLSEKEINNINQIQDKLKCERGEDIVLIAYKEKK